MFAAPGPVPSRRHLNVELAAARVTEAWGIQLAAAGSAALVDRAPATVAVGHQMTLEMTPIGILRSESIWMSCSGRRPNVVR